MTPNFGVAPYILFSLSFSFPFLFLAPDLWAHRAKVAGESGQGPDLKFSGGSKSPPATTPAYLPLPGHTRATHTLVGFTAPRQHRKGAGS